MQTTSNRSIFFLTLSFVCVWLILDNTWGKKYLDKFLSNIFPFYKIEEDKTEDKTETDKSETDKTETDKSETDKKVVTPPINAFDRFIKGWKDRQAITNHIKEEFI